MLSNAPVSRTYLIAVVNFHSIATNENNCYHAEKLPRYWKVIRVTLTADSLSTQCYISAFIFNKNETLH